MAAITALLDAFANAPVFAKILGTQGSRSRVKPIHSLGHVVPEAHPVIAAFIARAHPGRTWIFCSAPRAHERITQTLEQWLPDTYFFPDTPTAPIEGALPDPEVSAERLSILERVATRPDSPECIVASITALQEPVPKPSALHKEEHVIRVGQCIDREQLLSELEKNGYEVVPQISERGQLAIRGGIIDIFCFPHLRPVRIELFGDEIESIRHFDLDAQTSVENINHCTLFTGDPSDCETCPLIDLITESDRILFSDAWAEDECPPFPTLPKNNVFHIRSSHADTGSKKAENYEAACFETGLGSFDAGDFIVDEIKRQQLFNQLSEWRQSGWSTFLFSQNEGEQERLHELIPPVEADAIHWISGSIWGGFTCPNSKIAVLSDAEILGRISRTARIRPKLLADNIQHGLLNFSELNEGELVVHLDHGIARFDGLREMLREGTPEQVLVLIFAHEAKMYVPLEQSGLVSRYVGIGKKNPPLSELGDGKWAKARKTAERSVFDYAARLLSLHAERETCIGTAIAADNHWQREFESSFPYQETADQLTAIDATKSDMESNRPMDRLICGDVGFGKTEIAIRAAFKAVMGGKQVAMLVPTTVLAEQHYRNFRERMSAFPVRVEMLSRFRTQAQQRETLRGLKDGSVDIVIGTHRILSATIEFKDLGLVIIDEEQRFGVLHKERLKERFRLIDQLTLSATPIPRTLYLSLMGAKDMSTLETPPANRIPVETFICPYDERIIRDAIQRELARAGQVYFLHNRVESIHRVRDRLQQLVPKARIAVGHGQMNEHELEEVMHCFVEGRADVLISTTIIESGLDIPNANTILIDRADRFGLADLYQLRGRVGRGDHKAYAYLLLPRSMLTVGEARKRIHAIKQYSSLGAGFKIALRDLEIRGAGNILGTQQSGHIIAIGFDLYCSLLRQAIARHKGETLPGKAEAHLRLDFVASREPDFLAADAGEKAPAFIPVAYVNDSTARIAAYRSLSEIRDTEGLTLLADNWKDRFGSRLPEAVENLLTLAGIRIAAASKRIPLVEVKEHKVMLHRAGDFILIGNRFPRLQNHLPPKERLKALLKLIESL
ncbi:MAG: transcription-repair coupling factor [Verrucomicrobiota bacterium]